MKQGVYKITNAEYQAADGLSASGLRLLARSPLHYKTAPRVETPAMRKGAAAHCAVFEPSRFELEYIATPNIDRRTKAGKEAFAELEASGKTVLSADDYGDVCAMAAAVQTHPLAGPLTIGGVAEQSIFWNYQHHSNGNFDCKCRPDYVKKLKDKYIIVDLKTTTDASPEVFAKSALKLMYHIQAQHYIYGFTAGFGALVDSFIFVVVESSAPYAVAVYQCGKAFINKGYHDTARLYDLYMDCVSSDAWPGYSEHIEVLGLPKWATL